MPDYYASYAFKQLMGSKVLNSSIINTEYVRGYAQCSKNINGSISLLLINLNQNHTIITLPESMQQMTYLQYYFTPPQVFDITSPFVSYITK